MNADQNDDSVAPRRDGAAPVSPSDPPTLPADATHRGTGARSNGIDERRHTRLSGAWAAVSVAFVLGVALVDFIAENTRSVRIDFFSANGRMPVAVALIAAALCGAAVVLAVGLGRTAQLRLSIRHHRRTDADAVAAELVSDSVPVDSP
jgi:uncharacterized integral membrane protein